MSTERKLGPTDGIPSPGPDDGSDPWPPAGVPYVPRGPFPPISAELEEYARKAQLEGTIGGVLRLYAEDIGLVKLAGAIKSRIKPGKDGASTP